MNSAQSCPGCGAMLKPEDGPTHPYMLSSPACWRLYGDVIAREYASPALMDVHFLSVDAFAVQHPGNAGERRARQSVWLHLAGLHTVLRAGRPKEKRYRLLDKLTDLSDFPAQPPHEPFSITVLDIAPLQSVEAHRKGVRNWAEAALAAYETANADLAARLAALVE